MRLRGRYTRARRRYQMPLVFRPSRQTANQVRRVAWVVLALLVILVAVQAYRFAAMHGFAHFRTAGTDAFPFVTAVVCCLLVAAVLVVRPERLHPTRLVRLSAIWSILLLGALLTTWLLINNDVREIGPDGAGLDNSVAVHDLADVDRYLSAHALALAPGQVAPIQIPTGIFIETIEFVTANNVQISAFIWQRYGPQVPDEVVRGFTLPGVTAESIMATDAYTVENDDGSTVQGWHVHMTVRHRHDYRNFPFDRQDVFLRMWPSVPDRRVVLVPDFVSYPDISPASLPGLDHHFVGGGWTVEHTYFSLNMNDDNTTFGFPDGATPRGFPELSFNVGLKRNFVEPFIDDVLLAIVVALLLFAVVVLNSQNMDRRTRFGVTTFGVLATSGTLLFTVLTKHNQIRSEVTPGQIVYIEVLPFLLYVTILLAVTNAILLLAAPADRLGFIFYADNLLPDVIYWPALLGSLWLVTLFVFWR